MEENESDIGLDSHVTVLPITNDTADHRINLENTSGTPSRCIDACTAKKDIYQPASAQSQKVQMLPKITAPTTTATTSSKAGAGLTNMGNTCYINCSIQALIHSVPVIEFCRTESHSKGK